LTLFQFAFLIPNNNNNNFNNFNNNNNYIFTMIDHYIHHYNLTNLYYGENYNINNNNINNNNNQNNRINDLHNNKKHNNQYNNYSNVIFTDRGDLIHSDRQLNNLTLNTIDYLLPPLLSFYSILQPYRLINNY